MEENRERARRSRLVLWIVGLTCLFIFLTLLLTLASFLLYQREGARRERCEYNLAQLYRATSEYVDSCGVYPPAFTQNAEWQKLHSWRVLLLPFLGEEELFSQIRLDEPWDSEWNSQFWAKTPNVYRCASMPDHDVKNGRGTTDSDKCAFSCVIGDNTLFRPDSSPVTPDLVTDGASNTIMYVERKTPVNWMDPNSDLTLDQVLADNSKSFDERSDFGSWHGEGEYVLFCDGASRFLSGKTDDSVLALLLNVDDSADGAAEEEKSDEADASEESEED